MTAEIKFGRRAAKYDLLVYGRNEDILEEIDAFPTEKKLTQTKLVRSCEKDERQNTLSNYLAVDPSEDEDVADH
jgi:hypothetical protein